MLINGISFEVSVVRSSRKTLSVEIHPDGTLLVRAPMKYPQSEIKNFLRKKSALLEKHVQKQKERSRRLGDIVPYTEEELRSMADEALNIIPKRAAYYAEKLGVSYHRITIRAQKTRWGSCSSSGSLSFNCLLVRAPAEVLDSVVVHELCHLIQPNHSAAFYAEVNRVFPEYDRCHVWLKENGIALLRRLPGYQK